jgi:hypothetical protein
MDYDLPHPPFAGGSDLGMCIVFMLKRLLKHIVFMVQRLIIRNTYSSLWTYQWISQIVIQHSLYGMLAVQTTAGPAQHTHTRTHIKPAFTTRVERFVDSGSRDWGLNEWNMEMKVWEVFEAMVFEKGQTEELAV